MITWLIGAALLQAPSSPPTVGDTVWLRQVVAQPPGHVVRATDWNPTDPVELLGRPRIIATGDSAEISYPVVIWQPGHHTIELPGPLLLGPGGTVDSLRGSRVTVEVKSVLPPVPVESLAPQPRANIVPRQETNLIPLLILWLGSLVLLLPLHIWWRRRGKPVAPAPATPSVSDPPLERWADAGEYRAVATVLAAQLRTVLAERVPAAHPGLDSERVMGALAATRPDWPLDELAELLYQLDDARFGNTTAADVLDLSRTATAMQQRLHEAA